MYGLILVGLIISIFATESLESLPEDAAFRPLECILAMVGTTVAVAVIGLLIDASLTRRKRQMDADRLVRLARRLGRLYQALVLVAYVAQIYVLAWPALVRSLVPASAKSALLAEALMLAPFLVLVLTSWMLFFRADRQIRTMTSRPLLTLRQYLTLLARQHLLIVVGPLAILLSVNDVAAGVFGAERFGLAAGAVMVVALGLFIIFSSLWIRFCWAARRMPPGELRTRLESLARRARLRVRDILLWPTYNTLSNGCVVGPVGRFRYIMITDALVENLPSQEIEAVFAHEIGHIKQHHISLYIILAAGGVALTLPVAQLAESLTNSDIWIQTAVMVELVLFWAVVFGYISRRCELEADIYAVQATPCLLGCSPSETTIPGTKKGDREKWASALCPHKAVVFAEALERIARLNGASLNARSWRHFSIARRVRFVTAIGENPDLARRFERRLKWTKLLLLLLSAAAAVYVVLSSILET